MADGKDELGKDDGKMEKMILRVRIKMEITESNHEARDNNESTDKDGEDDRE